MSRFAAVLLCVAAGWASAQNETGATEMLKASTAEMRGQQDAFKPSAADSSSPYFRQFVRDPPRPSVRSTGTVVSAATLRHPVPKEAKKEYQRSLGSMKRRDPMGAEQHLLKAIAIDPEMIEAHCDLGALYAQLGRYPESEMELRRGLELAPEASVLHSNLSWVLFARGRVPDARLAAERALMLFPGNPGAHLLLGQLMVAAPATKAEGLQHLEIAAKSLPAAKRMLKELRRR